MKENYLAIIPKKVPNKQKLALAALYRFSELGASEEHSITNLVDGEWRYKILPPPLTYLGGGNLYEYIRYLSSLPIKKRSNIKLMPLSETTWIQNDGIVGGNNILVHPDQLEDLNRILKGESRYER